jgi:hypothetical protein
VADQHDARPPLVRSTPVRRWPLVKTHGWFDVRTGNGLVRHEGRRARVALGNRQAGRNADGRHHRVEISACVPDGDRGLGVDALGDVADALVSKERDVFDGVVVAR